jgi:hypothetical protein
MLQATKAGAFSSAYAITLDGRPVTRWDKSMWRTGGAFTLDGQRFEVRSNVWGTQYTMTDQSGATVATAGKVGRREWTVVAEGRTYAFRRTSWWRQQYDLMLGAQAVGFVRRPSAWRSAAEAVLPTMPVAAAVFTMAVALTSWDSAAATAAASSATM